MDRYKVNLSVLKSYKNDFDSEYKNFSNNTYSTFSSSYLKTSSDYYVMRMSGNLQNYYNRIKTGYKNINTWWNDYNKNIEGLENFLSDNGSLGAISESSIRNSAIKLPNVKNALDYFISMNGITNPVNAVANIVFDGTVSYFSDPFSSLYSDYKDDNMFVSLYNQVGSAMSSVVTNIFGDIKECMVGFQEWFIADACPFLVNFANETLEVLESVGATIVLFAQSLVEGLLQFGETIIDFVALVGTVVASIVTGLYDGVQAIYGAITGNEWTSVTIQMWNGTMGFVSQKYVSGWFDWIYQNTAYGQWITTNSFWFDGVRTIGAGIGYVTGLTLLTIATFGAGGIASAGSVGAGAVGTTGATAATGVKGALISVKNLYGAYKVAKATITPCQYAIVAGGAGFSKGTEDAWANGATLAEGLSAGGVRAILDGCIMFLNKADLFNTSAAKKTFKNVKGVSGFKNAINDKNVIMPVIISEGLQVGLSGIQGGVTSLYNTGIDSIYKDGYYDSSGNFVEFTSDDNIFERYSELFDDNGGWTAVFTKTVIAGNISTIINAFDFTSDVFDSVSHSYGDTTDVITDISDEIFEFIDL